MESYLTSKDKTKCSGCRCCEHVCPVGAISMEGDEEGFFHPKIDKEKCINCKMCEKRCPYNSNINLGMRLNEPLVYAVSHRNKSTLKKSSSGGMFSALAEFTIQHGGTIVGCIFDDELNPIHIIAEDEEAFVKMRGSKYIQSDTKDTFPEVEQLLKANRWVLFTGTPCQISGLKSYLKINYDKLITVDLICHGTPSNKFFQTYLKWFETKLNGKIVEYRFRDKTKFGWTPVGSFRYEKNGKIHIKQLSATNDYYYNSYVIEGNIYRESCYTCKYASQSREGDYTIGDFWNVHQFHKEFYSPEGVSLVLINTEKAKKIFNEIGGKINSIPSKVEYAIQSNGNLSEPSTRPISRDHIYKDVEALGFETAIKRYSKLKRIIPALKRAIPFDMKVRIKKIMGKV